MDWVRGKFEKSNPKVAKSEEELRFVHQQVDEIATKWAEEVGLDDEIGILGKKLDELKSQKNMSINKLNDEYKQLLDEFYQNNNTDIWLPKVKERLGIYDSDPDAIRFLEKILNDLEIF